MCVLHSVGDKPEENTKLINNYLFGCAQSLRRPLFVAIGASSSVKVMHEASEAGRSRVRFRCDDAVDCNRIISFI